MDGIANERALRKNQCGMSKNCKGPIVAGAERVKVKKEDIKDKDRETGKCQLMQSSRSAVPNGTCCSDKNVPYILLPKTVATDHVWLLST